MAGANNFQHLPILQGEAAGRLYQTDANGKLTQIGTDGIPEGYVLTRNATTGLWEPRAGGGGDPGAATGTPGNLTFPIFHSLTGYDVLAMPAIVSEHRGFKLARKYHNLTSVSKIRIQVAIDAVVAGGKIALQFSINSGAFWSFADGSSSPSAGPFVPTDTVGYPVPGDWVALDSSIAVNNVLIRAVTVNGDGTTTLTHGTVWVDTVSSASPPDTDTPTVPPPPSGGSWGSILHEFNANNIVLAPGDVITAWTDDTGNGHTGVPSTIVGGKVGPVYRGSGFGGGPAPYADIDTDARGFMCTSSFSGGETTYILLSHLVGTGSTTAASTVWFTPDGSGSNGSVQMQANGKFYFTAGGSIFGLPQIEGINVYGGDGLAHVVRIVHSPGAGLAKLFVDGTLEATLSDAVIVNGWTGSHYYGNAGSQAGGRERIHHIVRYNASHEVVGLNAIESALLAAAGL